MERIGIDVHKEDSQLCIVTEDGAVFEQRIRTKRERFAAVLALRARGRILLEASTESEWVARCLEELGHEVIVADPNFAAMYATRSRRVKRWAVTPKSRYGARPAGNVAGQTSGRAKRKYRFVRLIGSSCIERRVARGRTRESRSDRAVRVNLSVCKDSAGI